MKDDLGGDFMGRGPQHHALNDLVILSPRDRSPILGIMSTMS